jgi:Acetyltransferase (GNAT) domain
MFQAWESGARDVCLPMRMLTLNYRSRIKIEHLIQVTMNSLSLKPPPFKDHEFEEESHGLFETFRVHRYDADRKQQWDDFLKDAKNATFLFCRDYMDYHQDRFDDHSLMIFHGDALIGLVPANLAPNGNLVSHDGLTYGGLVVPRTATLKTVAGCFQAVLRHLSDQHIQTWIYKQIPGFYTTLPDDDAAYVLFLLGARLYRRDCAMTISLEDRLPLARTRKALLKKAAATGIQLAWESSFQPFWEQVLVPQLAMRYGASPVHTLEEITLLACRFPDNIKQFSAYCGDEIVSGTTIFETPTVAHLQYSAVSDKGRQTGAHAFLFDWLINHYRDKKYFDFGTSNEDEGRVINHGLVRWKEGFGARCFTHDFYEIATASYPRLQPMLCGWPEVYSPPGEPDPDVERPEANHGKGIY